MITIISIIQLPILVPLRFAVSLTSPPSCSPVPSLALAPLYRSIQPVGFDHRRNLAPCHRRGLCRWGEQVKRGMPASFTSGHSLCDGLLALLCLALRWAAKHCDPGIASLRLASRWPAYPRDGLLKLAYQKVHPSAKSFRSSMRPASSTRRGGLCR
jgi:hypothetical protein